MYEVCSRWINGNQCRIKKIIDLNDLIDIQPAEIIHNYWTITVITQVVDDEFVHCDTLIIMVSNNN